MSDRKIIEGNLRLVAKLASKFQCPLYKTKTKTLAEFTHKENAKVMAVTDAALSQAIINVGEQDLIKIV